MAEALRAGSRLERIGMVENLISEHNITDLADLMKVSEQLPPVLMREYRAPIDLMAVFTRPAGQRAARRPTSDFVADDAGVTALLRNAVARRPAASTCCSTAARHRQDRTGQGGRRRPPGWSCTRSSTPTATAIRCRARPLPLAADQPGLPEGSGAWPAVRRGRGRVPAHLQRCRPLDGAARQLATRAATGSASGKAWVNQILRPTRCR